MIIGGVEGGNTVEDVTMVIRVISTAVLVVPFLSVSKGYLQGHKIMQVSSIADILEQLARVIVILAGSFLTLKVFHLSLNTAVGVAVFGATAGALVAYFYVFLKIKKSKDLKRNEKATLAEKKITNKDLVKKIIFYAMPFVIISLLQSVYVLVDVFTVVKGLVGLGYTTTISENVVSVIQTWGSKLNMIVMSISTGIITSLIPTIASAYAVRNMKEVNGKVTQALQSLFLVTIPLSVGISFMSSAVWTVFYGYDELNSSIFKLLILSQIPLSVCSVMVNTNQSMNNTKATITALGLSLIFKIILNVPFMHLFNFLGLEAYFATISLNILIDTTASIYLLYKVKKETNISYTRSLRTLIKVIMCTLIMILGLSIMHLFIPSYSVSRFGSILYIILYGVVGMVIYFFVAYKSNTISEIVGKEFVSRMISKFKIIKIFKKNA